MTHSLPPASNSAAAAEPVARTLGSASHRLRQLQTTIGFDRAGGRDAIHHLDTSNSRRGCCELCHQLRGLKMLWSIRLWMQVPERTYE